MSIRRPEHPVTFPRGGGTAVISLLDGSSGHAGVRRPRGFRWVCAPVRLATALLDEKTALNDLRHSSEVALGSNVCAGALIMVTRVFASRQRWRGGEPAQGRADGWGAWCARVPRAMALPTSAEDP
jgi:hypothetical protein